MADNPITRKEKYLAKLTGSYTGNIPDPITRVEKYLYDLCQKGISGLTPEEIENAVNKYLKENPVQPGATEEQAQQIKQNTDDVALLKEDLSNKITKFYASNQGETHITDSDNGKIQDMMIYGKSSQDGTPTPGNPVKIKSVVNPTVKVSNEDGTQFKTVTLPYTLNAIPVNSGGNVTIDGQQYIADYVDVERGKLVRMCKEYVITGSERLAMYWLGNASYLRNVCCINNFENIVLYDGINPLAMSDMFIGKISENADDERAIYLMLRGSGDKTLAIKFLDSDGITTVDLAKQWLIEHKPKTVFVLSTPEEIDLTSEEITAFKALVTYYPTTNISVNSEQLDGYTVFNYPISMANIITSLKTKTENLESANYTDRGTLADTDAFLINDGTGMKKSVLSKLSDFVLNKIADKVFAKLQTNDKTILGAINELNSKTPNCTYMSPQVMINSNAWCEIATFSSNIWNRSFFTLVCGGDICAINYGHEQDSNKYLSRCNAIWLTNKDIKVGFKVLDNILHIYIKNDRVTRFISICCLGLCTENDITSFKLRNTTLEDADMDKIY